MYQSKSIKKSIAHDFRKSKLYIPIIITAFVLIAIILTEFILIIYKARMQYETDIEFWINGFLKDYLLYFTNQSNILAAVFAILILIPPRKNKVRSNIVGTFTIAQLIICVVLYWAIFKMTASLLPTNPLEWSISFLCHGISLLFAVALFIMVAVATSATNEIPLKNIFIYGWIATMIFIIGCVALNFTPIPGNPNGFSLYGDFTNINPANGGTPAYASFILVLLGLVLLLAWIFYRIDNNQYANKTKLLKFTNSPAIRKKHWIIFTMLIAACIFAGICSLFNFLIKAKQDDQIFHTNAYIVLATFVVYFSLIATVTALLHKQHLSFVTQSIMEFSLVFAVLGFIWVVVLQVLLHTEMHTSEDFEWLTESSSFAGVFHIIVAALSAIIASYVGYHYLYKGKNIARSNLH